MAPTDAMAGITLSSTTSASVNPGTSDYTILSSGTISSGNTSFIVNSSAGTLVNQGLITSTWSGISITSSGHETLIDNQGSISSWTSGVVNSGGIGTLTNSGKISADFGYAIENKTGASIGTLNNTGTISGATAILNQGTISTLTSSGSISGGVVNSGYLGIGGTVSFSNGVYYQSSGTLALGTSGELVVTSGVATITGGTVTASMLSTGNYLVGGSRTLISAADLVTGASISITNPTGLSTSISAGSGILKAVYQNDYIGGSLSSLSNSGTISGVDQAVYVASTGSLGSLTNSGKLSGSSSGLNNSGAISALTNSGTITGTNYALNNSGTISTLTNSGSIIGSVTNSGYLGIGDTVSVSGAFSQTSGTLALGSSGELILTGAASITAGTVTASMVSTGNYLVGDSRTLISAANLTSGASISIANPTGLSTSISAGSGILKVVYQNDYIGGSLSSLSNSGTISGVDQAVYVASTGSLGSLTNSGTISGGTYAINNAGTLGLITNSGLISGNISSSSDNLSIAGGTSSFGTLSGGTIAIGSSGSGTLSLTSGSLWLMDNITGTLKSSATVKLSTGVSVSGDYTQSSGALVIAETSSTSYGYLTVSGAATVTGTSITISGTNLTAGETFTIVRSASSGSYSSDTATVRQTSGLSASVSTVGNNLVVTLATCSSCGSTGSNVSYASLGQSSGVGGLGSALDSLSSSSNTSSDMTSILTIINNLGTSAAQSAAVKELAPSQSTTPSQMGFSASQLLGNAVETHQETAMDYDPATGKAAGSEAYQNALWGEVLGGGAIRSGADGANGYRMKEAGLASGVDHMFSDDLLGGMALSWVRGYSVNSDAAATNSTLDSYMATGYTTYRQGRMFISGQLGMGYDQFHQSRAISFLNRTATADFGGWQYQLRSKAGYNIPLSDGLTATPLAGLALGRSVNDGYTESGAGSANLTVQRQDVISLTQDIGGKLGWSLDTGWGRLKPEVRVEWVHDYRQSAVTSSGSIDGAAFTSAAPRLSSDGLQLGLAATLDRTDNLSLRAEYTGELRPSYQSHTAMVKAIWGF